MKKALHILLLLAALLAPLSCVRESMEPDSTLPDGTPVTMSISFSTESSMDVQVGTKAEATRADETRVHDMYVMVFASDGSRIYGRYFRHDHLFQNLADLDSQEREGWYVSNLGLGDDPTKKRTSGVVKITTEARSGCTLVCLANVSNSIFTLDGKDAIDRLTAVGSLEELRNLRVVLEQQTVNRDDLFLMYGSAYVNTNEMSRSNTSVSLSALDAKVKFRIKVNPDKIEKITPRYWKVCRVPESALLAPEDGTASGAGFFDSDEAYFEGTEKDTEGNVWQVFTFYMLENRQEPLRSVDDYSGELNYSSPYYLRELQEKLDDPEHPGYKANGNWLYAMQDATYVKFDVVLTLTPEGINDLEQDVAEALTSDAIFTVHLGDFTQAGFDDYNTLRGHSYTYDITINNSRSIYIEVRGRQGEGKLELEPGQEGSLLLTKSSIINCDSHYEYHLMEFGYDPDLGYKQEGWGNRKKFSWYVKTPFSDDGPVLDQDSGWYVLPEGGLDFRWVKFGLNKKDESGKYMSERLPYPGESAYDPSWTPDSGTEPPVLMDINQLINFLFWQNELLYEYKHGSGSKDRILFDGNLDLSIDSPGFDPRIRVTAFVDEYYYERDPISDELNPNLWRSFVNAKPRELHILSDAEHSLDRASDVILSSNSIIQQSIQTIYNIYAPDLSSLWGTEHTDETRGFGGWAWWKTGAALPGGAIMYNDDENGRLNSAGLWGISAGAEHEWSDFLDYAVNDDTPELTANYHYLAYSCLARNRDNNGNGLIDPDEVRWYTASINQLIGLWVGNESLSQSARLYQPVDASSQDPLLWRSQTVSSTCSDISNPRILRSDEGATKSDYNFYSWWTSNVEDLDKVVSVRCLRNIGTWKDQGVVKEISEAPFEQMVDQYFDFEAGSDENGKAWPNEDGTYTIRFTRLNSQSIREYSGTDLPYHDENSAHNRVYLRFTAQDPANQIFADKSFKADEYALNSEITLKNNYCPEGYRLPNMTELLLMAAVLPANYWPNDDTKFPCRSYFSRGKYGSNKKNTEANKVGWGYNRKEGRMNMVSSGLNINGIRCVRDDNMVGDITGRVTVQDSESRTRGGNMDIELNFSSTASAIRNVSLSLNYVYNGRKQEKRIPTDKLVYAGSTLRDNVSWTIPADLPVLGFMTVKATVLNAAGIERTFETQIRVISDLHASIRLLPCDYTGRAEEDETPPFRLLLTAAHAEKEITAWNLRITSPDKKVQTVPIDLPLNPDGSATSYSSIIYTGFNPCRDGTLQEGTYTFQLEAECDGVVATRSEEVSMEILKLDYAPNSDEDISAAGGVAANLTGRWEREMISGLDFSRGDFIETDMDLSRCVRDGELGLDDLISFGLSGIDWIPRSFHVYYPANNGDDTTNSWLYFAPVWASGNNGYRGLSYVIFDQEKPLHFRLDGKGFYWNNQLVDVDRWAVQYRANIRTVLDKLTAANTIYIGSTEGSHRSRARYRFVRVVYNGEHSSSTGGDSGFDHNPGNGGNL